LTALARLAYDSTWEDSSAVRERPSIPEIPFEERAMERRSVPTPYENCDISVVTEQKPDGKWAVVATITHSTEGAVKTIPVPVPEEMTFGSEEEARHFGIQAGRVWIDENMPKT
jgi:hypothetical protein